MKKIFTERAPQNSISFLIRLFHLKQYLPKNKEVLEIGCGYGLLSRELVLRGCKLTAIDYSQEAIEVAKKIPGEFVQCDFYSFAPKKQFDCIICTEVLEHLKDDELALEKIYSWLEPGGELILTVPICKLTTSFKEKSWHLRHYKTEKLIKLLERIGFSVDKKKEWGSFIRHFILTNCQPRSEKRNETYQSLVKFFLPILKPILFIETLICPKRYNLQLVLKKQ